MAGVLQSTLLADEDQSLSLGEPHLRSHQGAKAGGIGRCLQGGLVGEANPWLPLAQQACWWAAHCGRCHSGQACCRTPLAGEDQGPSIGEAPACQEAIVATAMAGC